MNWKIWIGFLISVFFIYLAIREVDLVKTWSVISSSNLLLLLVVVVILFFQFVIRAWRWYILLKPIKKTRFSSRLSSILIGFAANNIFPARLGEFVRANYLGYMEGVSSSSAFGTIVIERIFDAFTLLLVLLIGLMGTTFPDKWLHMAGSLRSTGFILLLVYIIAVIFLVGFRYKTEMFISLIEKIFFFFPDRLLKGIIEIVRNFSQGLVPIKGVFGWVLATFFSLLLWFTYLIQVQLVELSISLSLPFMSTFLILAMSSFGAMIPSAPGYIGTFHLAVQYGFLFYGIGREEALSAAIVWHASNYFPTILFGLVPFLILSWFSKKHSDGFKFFGR